jgi:rhodanese-related sulfurtransferase
VNIDVNSGEFGVTADSLLDKSRTVAVFCRSGRRSKKAAEILSLNGFNVVELDKGYNSWVEAGK